VSHPLNRILSRLSGLYKQHQRGWIFIFCLVLSAVFWTFNSLNRSYVYTLHCPLANSVGSDTISLTLEGKGLDLFSLLMEDSSPVIMPAPETYIVNSVQDTSPNEVPVEKFINYSLLNEHKIKVINTVPVTIIPERQTISMHRVPVTLVLIKHETSATNLDPGSIVAEPDSVNVYGSYAAVKNITQVLTQPVPYPSAPGVNFKGIYLQNPDPEKIQLASEFVWFYCNVAELTEASVTLPVRTAAAGSRYRLTTLPSEVKIIYQASTTEIVDIDASDFSVRAVIEENAPSQRALLVLDKKPATVRLVRIEPETVEYFLIEQL
jgi:hypothetical protein